MTMRSGYTTKERLAGSRGVVVSEGIRIERHIEDVFDFWHDLPNLPRFMTYVERVDPLRDGALHWVIKGPGGVKVEWDARIITDQRPRLLAWESIGTADVASVGSVRFTSLGADATDVEVRLQYDPPTGKFGAGMAAFVGLSASRVIREDLERLKQLIESHDWRKAPLTSDLSTYF